MHKYNLKCRKVEGYAPGLAYVRFNQRLVFHCGDTITKAPSFLLLQMTLEAIVVPIIHVDATQKRN